MFLGDTKDRPALMATGMLVNSASKFPTSVRLVRDGKKGTGSFFSNSKSQSIDLKKGWPLIWAAPSRLPSLFWQSVVSKPCSNNLASSETNLGMVSEPDKI